MRPQKVDRQQVINGLIKVIRAKGYEGSRLEDFSKATGLNKASLYNRFPKGKEQMASAILDHLNEQIQKHIHEVLVHEDTSPKSRLDHVLQRISSFYKDGEETCIIRALSLDSSMALFGHQITKSLDTWKEGFIQLGIDFGMDDETARQAAIEVLILIQGSLVVSKGSLSKEPFQIAIDLIRKRYLKQ